MFLLLLFVLIVEDDHQHNQSAAMVCLKVADKANPGEEAFTTSWAVVGWCRCGACSSGLACGSFLLCLEGSVLFHCDGSLGDDAAPAGSVGGK